VIIMPDHKRGTRPDATVDWGDTWSSDADVTSGHRRATAPLPGICLSPEVVEHALDEFPAEGSVPAVPAARSRPEPAFVRRPPVPVPALPSVSKPAAVPIEQWVSRRASLAAGTAAAVFIVLLIGVLTRQSSGSVEDAPVAVVAAESVLPADPAPPVPRSAPVVTPVAAPVAGAAPRSSAPPPPAASSTASVPAANPSVAALATTRLPSEIVNASAGSPTPVASLPPAPVAAPRALPVPSTTTPAAAAAAARAADQQAINSVLGHYQTAFSRLDANAAQAIWPGVNVVGLERVFGQLDSQDVSFSSCAVSIAGVQATARCTGSNTWVPKVGSRHARNEYRQWDIGLQKTGDRWLIASVDSSQ
jgi:hypothetical protein